jgi:hypothetical protein
MASVNIIFGGVVKKVGEETGPNPPNGFRRVSVTISQSWQEIELIQTLSENEKPPIVGQKILYNARLYPECDLEKFPCGYDMRAYSISLKDIADTIADMYRIEGKEEDKP